MPLSDTSLVAIAGLVSTLLATVITWRANERLQVQQREWQLEDQRRRRWEEYLNKELSAIREYVDDLTTVLYDEWEDIFEVAPEMTQSAQTYRAGLEERRKQFEAKWSEIDRSVWPHVKAVNDRELQNLVARLHGAYWHGLSQMLTDDESEATQVMSETIPATYERLRELATEVEPGVP